METKQKNCESTKKEMNSTKRIIGNTRQIPVKLGTEILDSVNDLENAMHQKKMWNMSLKILMKKIRK